MIGDASDIFARLKRVMPRWFGSDTPVLDAVLQAPTSVFAFAYQLYAYAKLQSRIATSTDGWLDLTARDFFGADLKRRQGQSDGSFRATIMALLLRERATRKGLHDAIVAVTGNEPRIFEPDRAPDTGGYGVACGYGLAGGWGSLDVRAQVFVDVVRPRLKGVPNVSGYGVPAGGFATKAPIEWASGQDAAAATDAEIYAAIERVRPVGVTVWVRITSSPDDIEEIVGGGSDFADGADYSDGAENYQEPQGA